MFNTPIESLLGNLCLHLKSNQFQITLRDKIYIAECFISLLETIF